MREEYDIKTLNPRKNPYAKALKKQVTINLDDSVIEYFKKQSKSIGIPYQTLINPYLRDCVLNDRHIHAYNEVYLYDVMRNLAALFDIAINALDLSPDEISDKFVSSNIASAIEAGNPNYLSGKSATEMLSEILDREIPYNQVPLDRSPEYWAGWVLAYSQWYLNKSFGEILAAVPLKLLIAKYYPYHEAPEEKTAKWIEDNLPIKNKLTYFREMRKLTKKQLSDLSGVNLRSINYYEEDRALLRKAQAENLYALAKVLDCTIEDLLD